MRTQLFDDLFYVLQLLVREERVVEQPIVGFAVFMHISIILSSNDEDSSAFAGDMLPLLMLISIR